MINQVFFFLENINQVLCILLSNMLVNEVYVCLFKCCQIWDAYNVKAQTFKTAIEAACMLLRIDDVVSGIKKKQPPGSQAPSKPKIETEADADNEQIIPD
jgi:hypothetical protein